jgi:hypothetical protein
MCVFDQGRGDSEEEVVQGGPKTIGQLAVLSAGSLTTVGPPAGAAVGLDEGLVVGETVVGLDKGLAVRESVVGLDESLVVGETVMGLDLDESDEEIAQGGPINEPSNEPINLDEKFFFDQHNDLCEVCNQPGFLLCCEKCNLVFHMHCVGLQVEPEVYLCTYCLADDNPSESQPSVYELQRMRRIENKDEVDDDEYNVDDDDDVNDEDVGTFSNEVEGGVPCAPHTTWIKRLHNLNQTPSYRRSDADKYEIKNLMKKLNEMKSRGEIGGKPCGLNISWTFEKKHIEEHRIGRMVGGRNAFKVYPEIICTGDNPSLGEVISAIKRTKNTKIGKDVSIIEVPVDTLEYYGRVALDWMIIVGNQKNIFLRWVGCIDGITNIVE